MVMFPGPPLSQKTIPELLPAVEAAWLISRTARRTALVSATSRADSSAKMLPITSGASAPTSERENRSGGSGGTSLLLHCGSTGIFAATHAPSTQAPPPCSRRRSWPVVQPRDRCEARRARLGPEGRGAVGVAGAVGSRDVGERAAEVDGADPGRPGRARPGGARPEPRGLERGAHVPRSTSARSRAPVHRHDADAANPAPGDVRDHQRGVLALQALAGLGRVPQASQDVAAPPSRRPSPPGLQDHGRRRARDRPSSTRPSTSTMPPPRRWMGATSSSFSSRISPTISSSRSSMVTRPTNSPAVERDDGHRDLAGLHLEAEALHARCPRVAKMGWRRARPPAGLAAAGEDARTRSRRWR